MRHLFRSNHASLAAGQVAWDAMTPDDTGDDTRTECEIFGHTLKFDGVYYSQATGNYEQYICTVCDYCEERKP